MGNNQSWILMLEVPFLISQPLIGFNICWVESLTIGQVGFKNLLAISGFKNLLAHFSRPGSLPVSFFTHITFTLAL